LGLPGVYFAWHLSRLGPVTFTEGKTKVSDCIVFDEGFGLKSEFNAGLVFLEALEFVSRVWVASKQKMIVQ
jgi:hypothetical protein